MAEADGVPGFFESRERKLHGQLEFQAARDLLKLDQKPCAGREVVSLLPAYHDLKIHGCCSMPMPMA